MTRLLPACPSAEDGDRDHGVEKIVRDLRVHRILEDTNEIMRLITARDLLKT